MNTTNKIFFSPGKVIISGEHSVVYGYPALVSSINLGITVHLETKKTTKQVNTPHIQYILHVFEKHYKTKIPNVPFTISSNLPQNSGLGSSSSLAYVLLQMCAFLTNHHPTNEEYYTLVQACEVFAHGKPSGIDASAVVFQGCLKFQRFGGEIVREFVPIQRPMKFFFLQSGRTIETTKEMVKYVAALQDKDPVLKQIGEITKRIEQEFRHGTFDPDLITQNERLLEKLWVVGDRAYALITAIEHLGGNAKIVGAGGRKEGSGMILVCNIAENKIKRLCKEQGIDFLTLVLGKKG